MPPNPEREPTPVQGQLTKTWEVSAFNRETNEWETTLNHAYDHQTADPADYAEYYGPVKPPTIKPSKRKTAQRLGEIGLVYGDGQVDFRRIIDPVTDEQRLEPLHHIPMHRLLLRLNADLRPNVTVNLGDFADMTALSDFPPDSDHFHKTLGLSMRWIHYFYAQMRVDNPEADHSEVDSNHAVRPKKQILKKMPALHDFVLPGEDRPMISYYRMANLAKLAINFYDGYGAAEKVYGEEHGPPIVFKHGNHSSATPGSTVRKEAAENPEVSVWRGHGHNYEQVMRTMRDGHQLFYIQEGTTCLNRGPVPGYHSAVGDTNNVLPNQQNHQNTISLFERHGSQYNIVRLGITPDNKVQYNGKEYDGNEPFEWEEDFSYDK